MTREQVSETIARLETLVARMENRYERRSSEMLWEVREGKSRETAEVARWLAAFQELEDLQAMMEQRRATG